MLENTQYLRDPIKVTASPPDLTFFAPSFWSLFCAFILLRFVPLYWFKIRRIILR